MKKPAKKKVRMIKQVIVLRKDLNVHKGKIVAQCCHGSIAFLTNHLRDPALHPFTNADKEWINGAFTKVCLQVLSEAELLDVHQRALAAGLRSILITDAGRTEFNGVPTNTVIAIGPDEAEKIDAITGTLKLY